MKKIFFLTTLIITLLAVAYIKPFDGHKTLSIGSPAPDFSLKGVDGKMYSLSSFKNAQILVIIFTCNHCPTAQAYEDRLIKLTSDYADKGVAVVAINPNDPRSLRLDELDFSDIGDSYDEMKIRAKEKKFNFPYLYDGDTQITSNKYGPVATPHVFVFDKERKLRYVGRMDDTESPFKTVRTQDARNAIDALLKNEEVTVKATKVFGCSIKWAEKKDLVEKARQAWAKEPVNIDKISEEELKGLVKNPSQKLRLIYIWSTSCGICEHQFPGFVTINRMYRDRDFEFISINADQPSNQNKALGFLREAQASNKNYFSDIGDRHAFAQSINPSWQGKLPYTILIEPGGKIVYAKQGEIDPAALKSTIVNNHLIGKYP